MIDNWSIFTFHTLQRFLFHNVYHNKNTHFLSLAELFAFRKFAVLRPEKFRSRWEHHKFTDITRRIVFLFPHNIRDVLYDNDKISCRILHSTDFQDKPLNSKTREIIVCLRMLFATKKCFILCSLLFFALFVYLLKAHEMKRCSGM